MRSPIKFTDDEIEFIRVSWEIMSTLDMARRLGRDRRTVTSKAFAMGLPRKRLFATRGVGKGEISDNLCLRVVRLRDVSQRTWTDTREATGLGDRMVQGAYQRGLELQDSTMAAAVRDKRRDPSVRISRPDWFVEDDMAKRLVAGR